MVRTVKDSDEIMKILFPEDSVSDAELIWREIVANKIPFEKLLVSTRPEYLKGLDEFLPDVIISDYSFAELSISEDR